MVSMDWDPNYVPPVKLGLHVTQVVLSFVLWCLEIVVFRAKKAVIVGDNGWTFAVCFLSIPAWIYLIMTPRFERTRRFAHPYGMVAVDSIFTIIWLSAFATQAAYNASGGCGTACGISGGVVALGVLITLLFGGTTFLSIYSVQYYNFHGTLPGYDARKIRGSGDNSNIDPDKAAFSMAPADEDAYERVHMDDQEASSSAYGAGGYGDSRYTSANPYSGDYDDPNRYGALPPRTTGMDDHVDYASGASMPGAIPYGSRPYDEGPAQFPAGPYDRAHP